MDENTVEGSMLRSYVIEILASTMLMGEKGAEVLKGLSKSILHELIRVLHKFPEGDGKNMPN